MIDQDFIYEHQAVIAVAAACHRKVRPSYSFHVLEWMCWKLRCKYPLIRLSDQVINLDYRGT